MSSDSSERAARRYEAACVAAVQRAFRTPRVDAVGEIGRELRGIRRGTMSQRAGNV